MVYQRKPLKIETCDSAGLRCIFLSPESIVHSAVSEIGVTETTTVSNVLSKRELRFMTKAANRMTSKFLDTVDLLRNRVFNLSHTQEVVGCFGKYLGKGWGVVLEGGTGALFSSGRYGLLMMTRVKWGI